MNPRQHPLPSKPVLLHKVGTVACGSRFGKGQAQPTALRIGRRGTKEAIDYFWQEGRIVAGHAIANFHSDPPAFGRPSSRIARDATWTRGPNGSIGSLGTLRRSPMAKSLSVFRDAFTRWPAMPHGRGDEERPHGPPGQCWCGAWAERKVWPGDAPANCGDDSSAQVGCRGPSCRLALKRKNAALLANCGT